MKIEIVMDGTGMAWVAYCEGLYKDGRNIIAGPSAFKEDVMRGALVELLRIIERERKAICIFLREECGDMNFETDDEAITFVEQYADTE